jgi:uncharacterized protein (DUF924 family)
MHKIWLAVVSFFLLSTLTANAESTSEQVLNYWFGSLSGPYDYPSEKAPIWFAGGGSVDQEIRERFLENLHQAARNELEDWADTPRGRLALIILLDQFTRNIYRNDGQAFAYDHLARKLVLEGIAKEHDREIYPVERFFFYLPLEHAENRDLQVLSVALFQQIVDETSGEICTKACSYLKYAKQHKAIIDRFGRYPHRNEALGRNSTADEIEFLKQPNSSF